MSSFFNSLPINIRGKITIPYLILGIILIIVAAFLMMQIVFDTIEERFNNQLIEAGILASERMVVEENQMLKVLRLLAYSEGVPEALAEHDPEQLRALTFGNIVNQRQSAVVFLDMQGNIVLSAFHIQGGNIEEYEFLTGGETNFKDEPFVQAVMHGEIDEQGNKYSGYLTTDYGDFFFISGPVFNEKDQEVGILLVGKSLVELAKQIREETLAQVTLYNFAGKPLASTFSTPNELNRDDIEKILDTQNESTLVQSNSRQVEVRNIDYREIFPVWEVRDGLDLGVMGIALGESFLVSTTRVTRIQIAVLSVLLFFLVIFIGVSLSRLITRPIHDLVQALKRVMGGDLNIQVTPSSKDEIGEMAVTFNEMISSIRDSNNKIIESYDSTLEGWARALDLHNKEVKGHTDRVIELMDKFCRELGFSEERLVQIRRGTLLHDIGKMGIPDQILNKNGKLSSEEWGIIRNHPTNAYEMLKDIQFLQPSLNIPYCHHERWDGLGYPRGLKGKEIPIEARAFALVDVWDAITNDRIYRKAMSKEESIQTIINGKGILFDPALTDLFLRIIS